MNKLGVAVVEQLTIGGTEEAARSMVASSAQGSLAQMIASLNEPASCQVVPNSRTPLDSDGRMVRYTLEFQDGEQTRRFFVTVTGDDSTAMVTDISLGS